MKTELSRRTVARSTLWAVPVIATAAAAPASAVSCTPTTVTASTALRWVSTQTDFSSLNGGDPELHTVQYTFTNDGPDAVPAGTELHLTVTMVVLQGEEATLSLVSTSSNVDSIVTNARSSDDAQGTTTTVGAATVTLTQDVAVNGTFVVTVLATFGALAGGLPSEDVTADSPQSVTNDTTCTTTITTIAVSGASDGTSYTSPG